MVQLFQDQFSRWGVKLVSVTVNRFSFPNLGQSCYINSRLQSLLTLEDFVSDVSRQDLVLSSLPEARLMRTFMAIRDARASTSAQSKVCLLRSFKEAVSAQAPEFRDHQQKDAHEFLTSILEQMRSLSPLLQETAANMGTKYTCPVEDHLVFKMENTRTCSRCGAQSKRQEEFTNLSLDLVSGGSVDKMLEEYQKDTKSVTACILMSVQTRQLTTGSPSTMQRSVRQPVCLCVGSGRNRPTSCSTRDRVSIEVDGG
ncbi:ubiquitin carboxyl-terminal hydrolase 37-like isoform X2 [Thunnus maccoyii]|uniref:ubiquitin carboxyl-terminal hydrolase 37-like isoform X2 n=1 Tax=Thunnus maccoyii TaxID=8240 RepID=UPI001C4B0430|nr:ubiquitin carboxyl-terminal hydrolase 37-like isoform X2 [Thunnus maccoyii]